MKIKLFSTAHLSAAKNILPDKFGQISWHNTKWTDEEINICKKYENESFILNPSYKKYKDLYLNKMSVLEFYEFYKDETIKFYEKHLTNLDQSNNKILSIACGLGKREFFLASKYNLDIIAVDNSPYTETLNKVTEEMKFKGSIKFINLDARKLPFNNYKFDFIISDSLLYCLEDNEITSFFNETNRCLKKKGSILITVTSRLSLIKHFSILLKKLIFKNYNINQTESFNVKQTGYMRGLRLIKTLLPANLKISNLKISGKKEDAPQILKNIYFILNICSTIFPIIGHKVFFIIKKNI
tara:strand:- start:104 stop:997 length:894 start_codon:yes stop_codon:yes gene_type:complete